MRIVYKLIRTAKKFWVEYKAKSHYDYCSEVFRNRLVKNGIPVNVPAPGEKEYIRFWQQFHKRVEPYTYRFFYRICGQTPHIVPEDIAYRFIERVLNPVEYRAFYSDKNMYYKYVLPRTSLPKAFMYRILGGLMYTVSGSGEDTALSFKTSSLDIADVIGEGVNRIVLKPSVNTGSGRNVMLFERNGRVFCNSDGAELSGVFLQKYDSDWIIQEVLTPHHYLQQFSKTSVNTMRIMTYRSVVDDSVQVFGAALRIGQSGSFVDNIFAGGGFVTINPENGELGKFVYDKYWQTYNELNGIDFSNSLLILPFWNKAVTFAKDIANQIHHARLLAQDLIIDDKGRPRLIEFNVNDFDWALSMTRGNIPFGDRFDEVINYCLAKKNNF